MHFKAYPKMSRADNTALIQNLDRLGGLDAETVVQEKIHGANLSFWTDGDTVRVAKRSALLKPGEAFFTAQQALETHAEPVRDLLGRLRAADSSVRQLGLYGELFGGHYPHPDVAPDPDAELIQKGIAYTPHNVFVAFDAWITGGRWVAPDRLGELLEACGIQSAPIIARGALGDCLHHPTAFPTAWPARFGLPPLDDNVCEGVILRTLGPPTPQHAKRLILKHKNRVWSEHQGAPDTLKRDRRLRKLRKLGPDAVLAWEVLSGATCLSRLHNVRSRLGVLDYRGLKRAQRALREDVFDALNEDHPGLWTRLDRRAQHALTVALTAEVDAFVQANFSVLLAR